MRAGGSSAAEQFKKDGETKPAQQPPKEVGAVCGALLQASSLPLKLPRAVSGWLSSALAAPWGLAAACEQGAQALQSNSRRMQRPSLPNNTKGGRSSRQAACRPRQAGPTAQQTIGHITHSFTANRQIESKESNVGGI